MLRITVEGKEQFNEDSNEFITTKEQTLQLEHSLVSLYKWESKWNKPFLSKKNMSAEETIDYIRCMTITQNVDPNVYLNLSQQNIEEVFKYIDQRMTATTIRESSSAGRREIMTAEVI